MLNYRTLDIYRLQELEESGLESGEVNYGRELSTTGRSITGHLQQASAEFAAITEGDIGRTFQFFTDDFDADILIGDELREGSDRYQVKGVDNSQDGPGRKMALTLNKVIEQ